MAAAAKALVMMLAAFQPATAHWDAALVSQSDTGPFTLSAKSPWVVVEANGNVTLRVNAASGAVRIDVGGQAHGHNVHNEAARWYKSMTIDFEAAATYDPRTHDITTWVTWTASIGGRGWSRYTRRRVIATNKRFRNMCLVFSVPDSPVPTLDLLMMNKLHYRGERHGDLIFDKLLPYYYSMYLEIDFDARTHAATGVHVMAGSRNGPYTEIDWTTTHSYGAARSEQDFQVPAAWGHCRRVGRHYRHYSELETEAEEMSTAFMQAAFEELADYSELETEPEEMPPFMQAAFEDLVVVGSSTSPAYFAVCTGFALGALSIGAVAFATATLRRRRHTGGFV